MGWAAISGGGEEHSIVAVGGGLEGRGTTACGGGVGVAWSGPGKCVYVCLCGVNVPVWW